MLQQNTGEMIGMKMLSIVNILQEDGRLLENVCLLTIVLDNTSSYLLMFQLEDVESLHHEIFTRVYLWVIDTCHDTLTFLLYVFGGQVVIETDTLIC